MILVIDDNPGFANMVSRTLRRAGYRSRIAATAEKGLDLLLAPVEGDPCELAIVDYQLDGSSINGVELARQARCAGVATKFVLISGYALDDSDLGDFEQVIGKPILATELIELANRHTGRSNALPLPPELAEAAAAAGVEVPAEVVPVVAAESEKPAAG